MGVKWCKAKDVKIHLFLVPAMIVLSAMVGIWMTIEEPWLEARRCEATAPFLNIEMSSGQEFSVWFFHSYDRSFFEEHYRLEKGGRIVLTRMTFKSSLNGQGFEMGNYHALPDGSAELAEINREVPEIVFRLGSPDMANHTLVIGKRRVRLLDYAEAGDMICIRSNLRSRWRMMLEKFRSVRRKEVTVIFLF